jgi:predicted CoA-binding protein
VTALEGGWTVGKVPESVQGFLGGRRLAVAGVSRDGKQAANAIFRKLVASGFDVVPVNPNSAEVEGVRCYPDLASTPAPVDGVVIATHPSASAAVARQCVELGIHHVWFHRSFGEGSVSDEAVAVCEEAGSNCIVGGCPLMFCDPVDLGHRCMRWWLQRTGRVPS